MPERDLPEAPTDEEEQRRTHRLKLDALEAEDREADVTLKKRLANSAIGLMFGQLLISDVVFFFYGVNKDWELPPGVIGGWLSATTVQVFAVVLVITEYLFPRRPGRGKP